MREIVYYSGKAVTTGNFKDLAQAGRMDIALHAVVHSFFTSNAKRQDVIVHLFFYGRPDPPKHLEIHSHDENDKDSPISKKDIAGLIKRMLYKYKPGKKHEALPGCFVEKKSILPFVEEMIEQGRPVYILDEKGEDIRTADIGPNPVFILGDHEGVGFKELRRLKKSATPITVGPKSYFASQVITLVQNELDRRGL